MRIAWTRCGVGLAVHEATHTGLDAILNQCFSAYNISVLGRVSVWEGGSFSENCKVRDLIRASQTRKTPHQAPIRQEKVRSLGVATSLLRIQSLRIREVSS